VPARHVALVVLAGVLLVAALYLFHAVHEPSTVAAAVPARHDDPPSRDESAPPVARPSVVASAAASHAAPAAPAAPELGTDDGDFDLGSGSGFNLKLSAFMDRANKAYDAQDYEEAKSIATKVLAKVPKNVRMMRIMMSSACLEGDAALAQEWYAQLPKPDRLQLSRSQRCAGITFTEPAQ
jgi:hypothetical protein